MEIGSTYLIRSVYKTSTFVGLYAYESVCVCVCSDSCEPFTRIIYTGVLCMWETIFF